MLPMNRPMSACWKPSEVGEFIRTVALATAADRSIFLATHAPMNVFLTPAGSPTGWDEESLLSKLIGTKYRSLTVLVGESGSGKSHLVQWLKFRWDDLGDSNDIVVLVPRVEGSLKGSLEHLGRQLGPAYGAPLANLARSNLNREGQLQRLLDSFAEFLNVDIHEHPDEAPEEAVWLTQNDAPSWFRSYHLARRWTALQPIISHLSSGRSGDELDSHAGTAADFNVTHLPSFVDAVLLGNGPSHGEALFRKMRTEVDQHVRAFIMPEGHSGAEALRQLENLVPTCSHFVRALNLALPFAVRNVVGLAESELLAKFMEVRRLLRADGKRLVFLLEDISNLRGVDKELLEALLPTPQEQEDICPLVAIVGVTRDYWEKVGSPLRIPNIVDRTDNTLCISSYEDNKFSRHAVFLRTAEDRTGFVARYLNGIRLGRGGVSGGRARESACVGCNRLPECHGTFGFVTVQGIGGDVGLFPFSKGSLEQFWNEGLRDTAGDRTLKTPRGLLNRVVVPVLLDAPALDRGAFPSIQSIDPTILEARTNREGKFAVEGRFLETIDYIMKLEPGNPAESESARRLRLELVHTYWGANLKNDVLMAFSLLAQSNSQSERRGPTETIANGKSSEPQKRVEIPPPSQRPTAIVDPEPVVLPPSIPMEFSNASRYLARWVAGERLEHPSFWSKAVDMARLALEPEPNFCGTNLWAKIFTKSNVDLQGVSDPDRLKFLIPRSRVVEAGLFSILRLTDYSEGLAAGERARCLVAVAAFQQEFTRLAVKHYEDVCGNLRSALGGSDHFGVAVRVAVAASGLAQRQGPLVDEMTLWHRTFISVAAAPVPALVGERQPALNLLRSTCDPHRQGLVAGLELLLGVGAQGRWLDAFQVRSALLNWQWQEWVPPHISIASIPHSAFRETLNSAIKCAAALAEAGGAIGAIMSDGDEVRTIAKDINTRIGEVALEVVLDRSCTTIQRIEREQPDLLTNQALSNWRAAHSAEILPLLAGNAEERPTDVVDNFLDRVGAASTPTQDIRAAHELILGVPWRELYRARRALKVVESTVDQAHAQGRAWLDTANLPERTEIERYLARYENAIASLRERGADFGGDHDDA